MGSAFSRPNALPPNYSSTTTATPTTAATSTGPPTTAAPCVPIRPEAASLPMKRKRRDKRGERKRRDNRKSRYDKDFVEIDERQNAKFAEYYRTQKIVPSEEHEKLLKTLASPLPSSFRIVADGTYGSQILQQLRGPMVEIFDGVKEARAPEPIPWVPDERAWVVSAPRQMLRRDNVLSPFHKFLVAATELGGIARQEAVSMIPPLLLAPKPGDAVLDMCAAPGSKTGQILEALSRGEGQDKLPCGGIVIANDTDLSRCWMLAHQLKRFGSSQLVVTNQDAQEFPKVRAFDRVLCDVPCSGDGTLRKAPDIWRRWHAGMGMGLHRIQCSILIRGIELLKPGGRLVYSTCSLNPIENEAIVSYALKKFGPDVIELLDVSAALPELKRRPGMTSWVVPNLSGETKQPAPKNGETAEFDATGNKMEIDTTKPQCDEAAAAIESSQGVSDNTEMEDIKNRASDMKTNQDTNLTDNQDQPNQLPFVEESPLPGYYTAYNQVPQRRKKKVLPSMFPPSKEFLHSGHCSLERCMRLVPYDQNTGGFFVAVFEKKLTAPIDKKMKQMLHAVNGTSQSNTLKKDEFNMKINSNANLEESSSNANEKSMSNNESATKRDREPEQIFKKETTKGGNKSKVCTGQEAASKFRASRLITDDPLIGVENLELSALEEISEFFGLDLTDCRKCLMTRGADADKFKKIVLVSPAVRDLLRLSVGGTESSTLPANVRRDRLRVVFAGVTMFDRTTRRDSTIPFRIVSDGAATLARCMRKRVICIGDKDFARLVQQEQIQIATLEQREARIALDRMGSGSTLVRDTEKGEVAVIWKSQHNLNLLIGKMERNALMQRVNVTQHANEREHDAADVQRADNKDDAVVPC